jgi:hypothetical protein
MGFRILILCLVSIAASGSSLAQEPASTPKPVLDSAEKPAEKPAISKPTPEVNPVVKAKPAPPVVASAAKKPNWWGERSSGAKKLMLGGGGTLLGGGALTAFAASMANNAIARRHQLQNMEALDTAQRSEFITLSATVQLGRVLHLSGLVLVGVGTLAVGAGGLL